jgi:lincosamide nucleotidyltransferase A/C/D/E
LTARDVGDVLGRLRAAGIDFWVEGGWGVDALLGEQTRPHDDLDLGVRSEQLPRLDEALAGFRRSDVEWPSAVVYEDDAGRRVDAHPLMFDASGDGWQANAFGGAPHRWPRDGLTGRGRIEDLDVPCITPELQLRWHEYPEFDDVDWSDIRVLCGRFGLEVPAHCRDRPGFIASKRHAAKPAASDVAF